MVDAKGHMEMLRRQLRALKFNEKLNYQGLILGDPAAYVTFYRRLLCDFNADLTQKLVGSGFSLLGTTDFRFMEAVYRILRDLLNLRPPITLNQFFTNGFVERKLEMASSIAARLSTVIRPAVRKPRHICSRSVKGPQSVNIPGIVYRDLLLERAQSAGGRMTHNDEKQLIVEHGTISPPRQRKVSQGNGLRLYSDHVKKASSPTAGDEPRKMYRPNSTEYYDQVWQEKIVKRPPIFTEVDSYPVAVWGEESHNQAAKRTMTPLSITQNTPTVFYASLPNVAQTKQTGPRFGSRSELGHTPSDSQYHLRNSNPRPCSFRTLQKINMHRSRAWDTFLENPLPSSRMTAQSFPSECMLPTENIRLQSSSTHQPVIRDILRSLSQLNCKVDNLITRLGVLETRLSETPKTERNLTSVGKNRLPEKLEMEIANPADSKYELGSPSVDQTHMPPSQSSRPSSVIRPPLLHSATIELQSPVREASEIGYSTVSSFSGVLTELPVLNSPKLNGTGHQAGTKHIANNPHRFSSVTDTENLPRQNTSSVTQNSPSKLVLSSSSPVNLADAPSTELYAIDKSQTEASSRRPSLRVTPHSSDSLKSPTNNLSKRTKWPPIPTTTTSNREGSYRLPPSPPKQADSIASHPISTSHTFGPGTSQGTTLAAIPNTDRHSERFSSGLFGRTDSLSSPEPSGSANSFIQRGDHEMMKLAESVVPKVSSPSTSESYQAQVDRITAMLAATQGLLESRRSNLLQGTT